MFQIFLLDYNLWNSQKVDISVNFQVFGLIKGTKIAVILDTSDANCGFGRLAEFQDSLLVYYIILQLRQMFMKINLLNIGIIHIFKSILLI